MSAKFFGKMPSQGVPITKKGWALVKSSGKNIPAFVGVATTKKGDRVRVFGGTPPYGKKDPGEVYVQYLDYMGIEKPIRPSEVGLRWIRQNPPFYAHHLYEKKTHGLNLKQMRRLYAMVSRGNQKAITYARNVLGIPFSESPTQVKAVVLHHVRDLAERRVRRNPTREVLGAKKELVRIASEVALNIINHFGPSYEGGYMGVANSPLLPRSIRAVIDTMSQPFDAPNAKNKIMYYPKSYDVQEWQKGGNLSNHIWHGQTDRGHDEVIRKGIELAKKGRVFSNRRVKRNGRRAFPTPRFVGKGAHVWRQLRPSQRMNFLYTHFTPQITPRSQEILAGRSFQFLPKNVKMAVEAKYANMEPEEYLRRNPASPDVTPVVFRTFRSGGEVIALFPYEPGTMDPGTMMSYQHIGQHGPADMGLTSVHTRPSTPDEIRPLKNELERIGYKLKILKRIPGDAVRVRAEKIRSMR